MVGSCRILEQIMKVYQTIVNQRSKHVSSGGFVACLVYITMVILSGKKLRYQ